MKKYAQRYETEDGSIVIHGHLNDPNSWHITIHSLCIFNEELCPKHFEELDIQKAMYSFLHKKREKISELMVVVKNNYL